MKKNVILSILLFFGLYIVSTGVSYGVFSYVISPSDIGFINPDGGESKTVDKVKEKEPKFELLIDNSGPKTAVCPINGKLYTEAEKTAWESRRPLLVMIENHEDARPQSGLLNSDVVYESVAEGGITRFMGVFYCDAQSREVILGPIRSARTFFLDWASEYGENPLYAHVGGANCNRETGSGCANGAKADALGQIIKYGWGGSMGNDLNQFAIGYPTFWRDYERLGRTVATEHTMYSTTERLWAVGKKRGWTNVDEDGVAWDESFVPWTFVDQDKVDSIVDGTATTINYNFWNDSPAGDYSVKWVYDANTKTYKRFNAGKPHLDLNFSEVLGEDKAQLNTTNLIVMYSAESKANDGYPGNVHLVNALSGYDGDGVWFHNGQAEEITWNKPSRTDRTIFSNSKGKEISFVPGRIWISNLPIGADSLKY